MLTVLLAAATAAASPDYTTPDAQQTAGAYASAILCAGKYVETAPFDRADVSLIASEAVTHCTSLIDEAVNRSQGVIAGATPELARENIAAHASMLAIKGLIARLERGDKNPALADMIEPSAIAGSRYLVCSRLALMHELEKIHLGDEWLDSLRGLDDAAIIAAFAKFGRAACPATQAELSRLLAQADKVEAKQVAAKLRKEFSAAMMEDIALRPFVRIIAAMATPDARKGEEPTG